MNPQTAEQFIRALFTEVWMERNKDAVAKYYHPEFLGLLHGEEEFRYADVLKRVDYSKSRYANPRTTIDEVFVAEPNRIVARISSEAFDVVKQQPVAFYFMLIIEMQDGKMIRQWAMSNQPYRYKEWE